MSGLVVERVSDFGAALDLEIGAFLDSCPTSFAQQTAHWRSVVTSVGQDEPIWLLCRRGGELQGVLPAYRFEGPLGAILCSVPQPGALGGVAAKEGVSRDAIFEALLVGFSELAVELACDLATAMTNPFWDDAALYARHLAPDFVLENSLLALTLTTDVSARGELTNASTSLRRNLRRAQAGDLVVDDDQSRRNVEEWIEIHEERHREIGATPLPRELFLAALEHMVPADRAHFFFVRCRDGEMAAGGLYLHHGRVLDAFMPSIRTRHAALRPNHLLAWHTIQWAKQHGFRFYNWQASPPDGGVRRFKEQWGSREYRYSIVTRVTGDATPYLEASIADLLEGYPRHYVLPYDALGEGSRTVRSRRETAWRARERAESGERGL